MIFRAAAAVALVLLTSACFGRSDSEVAQQRKALEDVLAQAPLPAGSTADRANARFDKGCQGFAECADAGDKQPVYQVPITGAPAELIGACRYFAEGLEGSGFTLVSAWRGNKVTAATHPDLSKYPETNQGSGLRQRWVDVDVVACDTGKLTSAVVVREDGSPLNPAAYLELVLSNKDGAVSPYYEVTHKAPPRLPVKNTPLTESELAHLRGVLDRQFVLAAHPQTDGIEVLRGRAWLADWDVPAAVTGFQARYTCSAGDELAVEVRDLTEGTSAKRAGERTVDCTGKPESADFAELSRKVKIQVAVKKRPASPTGSPGDEFGPFVVELVPVR